MVQYGNPAEGEATMLYDDSACFLKQFTPVADADDRRIDAASHGINAVETLDLAFRFLPIGDVSKRYDCPVMVSRSSRIGAVVYSTGKLDPSLRQNTSSSTLRTAPSRMLACMGQSASG
jgi:hypothetical protein